MSESDSPTDSRTVDRPPAIFDVVPFPASEQGRECPLYVGENPHQCGNDAVYVFVYEKSLDPDDDRRGNCLCCAECRPKAPSAEATPERGLRTDGGTQTNDEQEQAETLCGDPDCPVCSSPGTGTCADGFSNFIDHLNGGDE